MADHNIDILIRARDQASKTIGNVNKQLGRMGTIANQGVRTAARNLARLGAVAAGAAVGIGVIAVKSGIQSLATLESATTSVTGAIQTMGQTGQVSASQIATWANDIEGSVQAAFDDKDITAATANLIRFGKVTPQNLRPAMVVMTDLAAKTGSVDSASSLLGKALADPTKAAGKLARQGIVLTKAEQKQIDAFVKAGKTAKAQALLIEILGRTTKNAARDSVGPYGDALNELSDAGEDATRLLAQGFLPVIQKTAKWLNDALADPEIQKNIKTFGQNLADGFDQALEFAKKIPWGAIADGLKGAAGAAKTLFDAFRAMPPEVQSTLAALAGLDAISGGAVHNIVGELGKGLIKGVLGMTAAVVNIKAGVVTGGPGGGLPTPGGAGAAGAALGGTAGAALFVPDMHQFNNDIADRLEASGTTFGTNAAAAFRKQANNWTPWDEILASLGLKDRPTPATPDETGRSLGAFVSQKLQPPLKDVSAKQADTYRATLDAKAATQTGLSTVSSTTRTSAMSTTVATTTAGSRIVAAIASASRAVPIVNVSVGPTSITRVVTVQGRVSGGTSRGSTNDRGQ